MSYDAMVVSEVAAEINGAVIYAQIEASNAIKGYLLEILEYIKEHPELEEALKYGKDAREVYKGAKEAIVAGRYTGSLNALVKDYGSSGGASVLGVFVDRFAALAKYKGIEVNECALSVAKVATDIGGAGVGALTSVSGFGVLLLAVSVVSTFQDSYSLGKACFSQ
jgi:hypothetical protein